MGKKKKHPEHENLERWLVSYADFITLLFATFTALYAMAKADVSKMKDVSSAISQGFEQQSLIHGVESLLKQGGKSSPGEEGGGKGNGVIGAYKSLTYSPGEVEDVQKNYKQLKQAVDNLNKDVQGQSGSPEAGKHAPNLPGEQQEAEAKGVDVAIQERGLKVSFDSRLLFTPGTANLKPESLKRMDDIAKRLKNFDRKFNIHVEGHTDNQPIVSAQFPSNWELSAARASSVIRLLINKYGFDPEGLAAIGFGDSRPLSNNDSPEGRRKNRRVDIIIYSARVHEQTDPIQQFIREKNLIKYEERDANNQIIKPVLMESHEEPARQGPASIIIKDPAGNIEKIITPLGNTAKPSIVPDLKDAADKNTPKTPEEIKNAHNGH